MLDTDTLNALHDLMAHTLCHAEVKRLHVLTHAEEHSLIARARQGDSQASTELLLSCLRYAWWKAHTLYEIRHPFHIEQLDLIEGMRLPPGIPQAT